MVHFQSKRVLGEKSGGEAGKAHHTRMIKILLGPSTRPGARQEKTRLRGDTNGHAIPRSRGVVGARERADGLLRAAVAPIRVLMTKNATNIRYSCTNRIPNQLEVAN